MYRIKQQRWQAKGIEQRRTFTPSRFWAVKCYLRVLHKPTTDRAFFENLKTNCACWPEFGPCPHEVLQ